jgi:hypothetical protein
MSSRRSYRIVERFVLRRKNGLKDFMFLIWAINNDVPFRQIADSLGLSLGRISQIVSAVTKRVYVLTPGAEDCINNLISNNREVLDDAEKKIEEIKRSNLRLIKCGLPDERLKKATPIRTRIEAGVEVVD